jgi:hypothetical protein
LGQETSMLRNRLRFMDRFDRRITHGNDFRESHGLPPLVNAVQHTKLILAYGEDPMVELISIICSLAICIITPIEVGKIRAGWVRAKFAGDREKFLAAYRKQLTMLTWVGVGFGVLSFGLAFIEAEPGESTVKVIAGVVWLVVACVCFISRRMVPDASMPESIGSTSA